MANHSLEDLMAKKTETASPSLENNETLVAATKQDLSSLTQQDLAKVQEVKEKIDLTDAQLTSMYGTSVQKQIATFSDTILQEIKAKDAGQVGTLLTDMVVQVEKFDTSLQSSFLDKIPFLNQASKAVERYLAKYNTLELQIDKITSQLENARMSLLQDIGMYDKLYDKNKEYFHNLQIYIAAGQEKIKELREVELPKLYAEANQSNDPMALQVVNDYKESIDRFEKRIHDLDISKTIAIQTAPQIKLIQNNDKLLAEKISDSITTVIPLWKSQIIITLGLDKQRQVLDMQEQISNTTNRMLKENAAKLKQNTIATAKEAERSIVDIETVKKVNQDLIETLKETRQIHEASRQNRQQAEKELRQIESDLQVALVESIGQPQAEYSQATPKTVPGDIEL
ncbi:toxic anion resistance protein [Vaginisenegalia massiliensis]|uniref:toxic anion resistance protein n=1 Tax=Vaginisenegalia massiliensis TaxID=2058294 RepID=UPI000F52EACF|nr:toxic anion resistance protein [Vaginisenegalia massiliensis]